MGLFIIFNVLQPPRNTSYMAVLKYKGPTNNRRHVLSGEEKSYILVT